MNNRLTILLAASAASVQLFAGPPTAGGYVAHEWGTFTSVQGANGIEIPFRDTPASELPEFVHDLTWPAARNTGKPQMLGSKATFGMLQRMETPVIYFYSETARRVRAAVEFPKGVMTEWYPADRSLSAIGLPGQSLAPRLNVLDWDPVEILAPTQAGADPGSSPRTDASGSHYYAARETDANLVRAPKAVGAGTEVEKFLFYRGVGNFQAPLKVRLAGERGDVIELTNRGADPLAHLFVYEVRKGAARLQAVPSLKADQPNSFTLGRDAAWMPLAEARVKVAAAMQAALVSEGLYEREAAAMVKTWDDSWFAEPGLRVLYTLPRSWTDTVLPLRLEPAPQSLVRVMVGRAEMLTPEIEFAVLTEVMRHATGGSAAKATAVENVRRLGLGRFGPQALDRIMSGMPVVPALSEARSALDRSLAIAAKPERSGPHQAAAPKAADLAGR